MKNTWVATYCKRGQCDLCNDTICSHECHDEKPVKKGISNNAEELV